MMQITTYTPKQFNKLEEAWRQLETGKDMTVFQKYDWFKNINELYFRERIKKLAREWIYIKVSDDNDNPLMIAPIEIVKVGAQYKSLGLARGAYFIGRQGFTDYINFIYDEFNKEAAKSVFDYLKTRYHIKRVCLEQLLDDTELHRFIVEQYHYQEVSCYCAALVLPETFDEYKKRLSKSTRQNIRTAINRQKRDSLVLTHEIVYDVDESILDTLMEIRDQRLGDKKKMAYSGASWKGKLYNRLRDGLRYVVDGKHDVIRECCDSWAFLVKKDTRIVSYFWGLRNDEKGELYVILAGVDKEFAWYSPSLSHLYLYLQEQYENPNRTLKVLDFTRGGERYKTDMGGEKRDAWTITFRI